MLFKRRYRQRCVASRRAARTERREHGRRKHRHFFVIDYRSGACAAHSDVKPIIALELVDRANKLPEISRREIRRRLLAIRKIQRSTVSDRDNQRAYRRVGRNHKRYAFDELCAVIVSSEGLHLDALAPTYFSFVYP